MNENTYDEREAIRRWTVRQATLIIDNDERLREQLNRAAVAAVMGDMGTGVGPLQYEAMLRGRGHTGYEREEYERVVGRAVVAELQKAVAEWEEKTPPVAFAILAALLDLYDSRQADHFGHHFLPEDVDDIPWPGIGHHRLQALRAIPSQDL